MSKFFMECPSCKMPVLASTGLFAKKKIKCGDCGCLVMVEKMAEEPCPKCGSAIVYDRSKTSTPKCPSCSHIINVDNKDIIFFMIFPSKDKYRTKSTYEVVSVMTQTSMYDKFRFI